MFKSRVTLTGLMGLRLTEDHTRCGLVAETGNAKGATGQVCSRGSVSGRVRWEKRASANWVRKQVGGVCRRGKMRRKQGRAGRRTR